MCSRQLANILCISPFSVVASQKRYSQGWQIHLPRASIRSGTMQCYRQIPPRTYRSGTLWRAQLSNDCTGFRCQQLGTRHQELFAEDRCICFTWTLQNSRYVTLCGEFLHQKTLTLVEQLLVLGMLGFCYSTDHIHAMFWLSNAFLQLHCRYLNSVVIQVTERNTDFMTWVATVLTATFDPGSQPWILALSLLKARPTQRDWRGNVKVSETFFLE